ncbi:hypothetical protein GQ457_08G018430 [Hibiscus cannabinus]
MPSCYASYHHRSISHRLISHPTKPRPILRLTQHSTKVEAMTHSGSPRSSYDSLSGMLSFHLPQSFQYLVRTSRIGFPCFLTSKTEHKHPILLSKLAANNNSTL